ncbi:MAG TPA: DNA primase, partial [Patescibacteria group bacterium]|nr:DNA primase [Patescibacteria group bacterium]
IVSPEKQIWKDFSSGKGGSIIDFIMEVEGLDFREALEFLAKKAGIELEQFSSSSRRSGPDKERLYNLLDVSTKFYQVQLANNKSALDYVKKRKFTKKTILAWRLGYAPNTGRALTDYLKNQGYSDKDIRLAGLSSNIYKNSHDMFRARLIIPLSDPQGRVIGFTARLLRDIKDAPKYINTPQTPLYDKSQHVYGYHLAKDAIRKNNYSVITEGNLDVITSHQAGVSQVVATAGTALTLSQLKLLSRLSGDIRIAFDRDKAGLAATERAIPIAQKAKVSLSIIDIPSGKDPDELINSDPNKWLEVIDKPIYAIDWLMQRYKEVLDLTTIKDKKTYSDILLPILRSLDDPVELDHYLNLMSKELTITKDALEEKLNKNLKPPSTTKKRVKLNDQTPDKNLTDLIKIQDKFLSLTLTRSTLREFLLNHLDVSMMPSENGKQLFTVLKDNLDTPVNKLKQLKNIEEYVKILSLLYEELYMGLELNELYEEAARMHSDLITKYVKIEKEKLSSGIRRSTNDVDTRALQEKDKQFNNLLRDIKGEVNA